MFPNSRYQVPGGLCEQHDSRDPLECHGTCRRVREKPAIQVQAPTKGGVLVQDSTEERIFRRQGFRIKHFNVIRCSFVVIAGV